MTARIGPAPEAALEKTVGLHQILPSQYFELHAGNRFSAEQRLMLAMLADALNVYRRGVLSRATRKRLLYLDAERWIMAGGENAHAFGFETVCDALGINAAVLRRNLVAWKHRASHEPAVGASRHLRLKTTPRERRLVRPRPSERRSRRSR
jgi:hypothetical protein